MRILSIGFAPGTLRRQDVRVSSRAGWIPGLLATLIVVVEAEPGDNLSDLDAAILKTELSSVASGTGRKRTLRFFDFVVELNGPDRTSAQALSMVRPWVEENVHRKLTAALRELGS